MKITTTKMNTKIKWNESFVFFQGEEKKKEKKKKTHWSHIDNSLPLRVYQLKRAWWVVSNVIMKDYILLPKKSTRVAKKIWAPPTHVLITFNFLFFLLIKKSNWHLASLTITKINKLLDNNYGFLPWVI
jgi:hypothetical protein